MERQQILGMLGVGQGLAVALGSEGSEGSEELGGSSSLRGHLGKTQDSTGLRKT
jgi:hypothetical protein